MKYLAEYVSSGHPDRLADAVADGIVRFTLQKDRDALVGVEVALHRDVVFIDGRIAAGYDAPVIDNEDIKKIVRDVYSCAGYSNIWGPAPEKIKVITDLSIEILTDDERQIRNISDDQNIVRGYALNNSDTNYFPPSHYVANELGKRITEIKKAYKNILGPDFKLLVSIKEVDNSFEWERLVFSCQHNNSVSNAELQSTLMEIVRKALNECFKDNSTLCNLAIIEDSRLYINGAGDFLIGGPYGDNGLSGKKLAVDFYGTEVAIGGGAIYGKDYHKVDVVGAYFARKLAKDLVKKLDSYSIETRLSYSPGEEIPYNVEAYFVDEFGIKRAIESSFLPPKDCFSLQHGFFEIYREQKNIECSLSMIIS